MDTENINSSKGKIFSIVLNVILAISLIVVSICFYKAKNKAPSEEYVQRWAYQDISHIKQSYATIDDAIQITFLAHNPDKDVQIEITIYDKNNTTIAVIKKGYEDIIFNSYDLNYKIKILKTQYPTAKSAKITSYRYTVYEKK